MKFLIQLKRTAIPERHFCTKLKRNLTSAIEISQNNANTALFAILGKKRVNNLLSKFGIYQNYDRDKIKSSSVYRIELLTEKKLKAQCN